MIDKWHHSCISYLASQSDPSVLSGSFTNEAAKSISSQAKQVHLMFETHSLTDKFGKRSNKAVDAHIFLLRIAKCNIKAVIQQVLDVMYNSEKRHVRIIKPWTLHFAIYRPTMDAG